MGRGRAMCRGRMGVGLGLWVEVGLCAWGGMGVGQGLWVEVGLCVWGSGSAMGRGRSLCMGWGRCRCVCAQVQSSFLSCCGFSYGDCLVTPLSPLLFFLKNLSGGGWVGWDWDGMGWGWGVGCGCGCGGFMLVKFFVGMLAGRQMGRDGR